MGVLTFEAYIHGAFGATDSEKRTKINVDILRNAILAVESLCPNLRFWTLQSGAKVRFPMGFRGLMYAF